MNPQPVAAADALVLRRSQRRVAMTVMAAVAVAVARSAREVWRTKNGSAPHRIVASGEREREGQTGRRRRWCFSSLIKINAKNGLMRFVTF